MKYRSLTCVLLCAVFAIASGCIPSAPPEPESVSQQQPAPPAPEVRATPPTAPAQPDRPAASDEDGETPPPDAPETTRMNVPLDMDEMPPGTVAMPVITLTELGEDKGYMLHSHFPIEGLSMSGTLVRGEAPSQWLLSGHFTTNIEAFEPGDPGIQMLGIMDREENGTLVFVGGSRELLITFPAPLPPEDAPRLEEPKVLPFSLSLEAPDDTAFMILLLPF